MIGAVQVTAVLAGGASGRVAGAAAALAAQTTPVPEAWVLQSPHDSAVDALAVATERPRLRIIRADAPFAAWAPLMLGRLAPTELVLLIEGEALPAPRFLDRAHALLRRFRCAAAARGRRAGADVVAPAGPTEVETGAGAWLLETSWIGEAWRQAPVVPDEDPFPGLARRLRRAGVPTMVPHVGPGEDGHLIAAAPPP